MAYGCTSNNKQSAKFVRFVFTSYLILHQIGFNITLLLSVVNLKMKAYLQELIPGAFTVTFFI